MSRRTSLILDDESLRAARQLAARLECPNAEAIRRAVVGYRDLVLGIPREERSRRLHLLEQLFELFEGNDPEAEIARLKAEDEGF